jgi:hypothetical protein
MTPPRVWYRSALICLLLFSGCAQWDTIGFKTTPAPYPAADFAYVYNGRLQLVSQSGVVTSTTVEAEQAQPAVSADGTTLLYTISVGEKSQLMLLNLTTTASTALTPLASAPQQLLFSSDQDLALVIVEQDLYLLFIPQQRLVRVHEGVQQAMFSESNQRVEYQTTDGRLLSREFAADGSLADALALADDPFTDLQLPERAGQITAGWSKHGLGVYSVDSAGHVTLIELTE